MLLADRRVHAAASRRKCTRSRRHYASSRGGAKSSCEENADTTSSTPIPALESEPKANVVKDREVKAENASQNEGECASEDVVDEEAIVIDDIR